VPSGLVHKDNTLYRKPARKRSTCEVPWCVAAHEERFEAHTANCWQCRPSEGKKLRVAEILRQDVARAVLTRRQTRWGVSASQQHCTSIKYFSDQAQHSYMCFIRTAFQNESTPHNRIRISMQNRISMPTPCLLHAYSMPTPCLLLAYSMPTPCLLHAYSMPTPCLLHAYCMPTPCLLHAYSMPTPCLLLAYSMPTPCLLHAYSMPTPCLLPSSWDLR
jgi:hypothetical protein